MSEQLDLDAIDKAVARAQPTLHALIVGPLCQEVRRLTARVERLRDVCAEAYQMAGALGAPTLALDKLSAAAHGSPIPEGTYLPVEPRNGTEVERLQGELAKESATCEGWFQRCEGPGGLCDQRDQALAEVKRLRDDNKLLGQQYGDSVLMDWEHKNEAESNARDAEQLAAEIERLRARIAELEAALVRIQEDYGHVCENFATCDHTACRSSYGAWFVAGQALGDNVAQTGADYE